MRSPLKQVDCIHILDDSAVLHKLPNRSHTCKLGNWVIELALSTDFDNLFFFPQFFVSARTKALKNSKRQTGSVSDLIVLIVQCPGSLLSKPDNDGPVAVLEG